VNILLDWKSLESALPDTPARLSLEMVAMTVGREQPVHPPTDVASTLL
jgi:hypothetical protein